MGGDMSEAFGGALSGAALGTSVMPGIGTAVGAGAGFLGDLIFGGKKNIPQYNDPNAGMIQGQIMNLLSGDLGNQMASRVSGQVNRNAQLSMQQIQNRQGLTNANVLQNLYDGTRRQAEGGMIDAQLMGNQINQQARSQAAGLIQHQQGVDFQTYDYNRQLRERFNPLQQIGLTGLGSMVGQSIGNGDLSNGFQSLFGGGKDPGSPGTQAGSAQMLGGAPHMASPSLGSPSSGGSNGWGGSAGVDNPFGAFG